MGVEGLSRVGLGKPLPGQADRELGLGLGVQEPSLRRIVEIVALVLPAPSV